MKKKGNKSESTTAEAKPLSASKGGPSTIGPNKNWTLYGEIGYLTISKVSFFDHNESVRFVHLNGF